MGINEALAFASKIINGNTGYDWDWERWTHSWPRDGKTFTPNKEADCSSLVGSAVKAGFPAVDLNGLWYTGNMKGRLEAIGFTVIKVRGLTLSQLKARIRPGDVMLNVGYHTEIVGHDLRFGSASINELGKPVGGRPGNQTGRETRWTPAYVYSKGWDFILRPPASGSGPKPNPNQTLYNVDNYSAAYIREVQQLLIAAGYSVGPSGADGSHGPDTNKAIRAYQKDRGLVVDGLPGQATITSLRGGKPSSAVDRMKALQRAIGADPDAKGGPDTRKRLHAVKSSAAWGGRSFPYGVKYAQLVVGTAQDNSWGPNSIRAHDRTVAAIQKAIGVRVDNRYGPTTDAVAQALVKQFYA